MKKYIFSLAALSVITAVFAFTLSREWTIKSNYSIAFSGSGVSGIFKTFSGTLVFDPKDPAASSFNVAIDAASINTGNGLQNKHAKSANWLDVEKYPKITFISAAITGGGNQYNARGTLDLHGVKKEIDIPFSFTGSGNEGSFTGSFSVNRNDYGIGKPGKDVSDILKIELNVPVTRK